ncbi:MAG: hypothetical protein L3J49_05110, partial [Desulfobulbaceae bacterium]|nr:hypothetical protein [Desulfobulbaceae bacterium]
NGVLFSYLQSSAAIGNITLITDYIGFGKSEQFVHPYLHKESTVLSVENFIVAAKEMMENDLIKDKWNSKLYLMGYSQGEWATLSTHKDIVDNNASLNITASACGAGPYDLPTVQNFMFENATYPQPVYMAYTMVSYLGLCLIDNPITDFFNEPYATPLPSYFEGQYSNGEINLLLNDTVSVLMAESFLNGMNTELSRAFKSSRKKFRKRTIPSRIAPFRKMILKSLPIRPPGRYQALSHFIFFVIPACF